jgi:hypothetical protein
VRPQRLERVEDALSLRRVLLGRDVAAVTKPLKLCQSLLDRLRFRGAAHLRMRVGVAVLEPLQFGHEALHVGRVTVGAGFATGHPGTAQLRVGLVATVAAIRLATARRCRPSARPFRADL